METSCLPGEGPVYADGQDRDDRRHPGAESYYLVDANILSEPTKPAPDPKVVEWLIANEGEFVVDSIILGELLVGILMLPAGRKRTRVEQWLEAVARTIDCVLWDTAVSRRWARLVVDLRRRGTQAALA